MIENRHVLGGPKSTTLTASSSWPGRPVGRPGRRVHFCIEYTRHAPRVIILYIYFISIMTKQTKQTNLLQKIINDPEGLEEEILGCTYSYRLGLF